MTANNGHNRLAEPRSGPGPENRAEYLRLAMQDIMHPDMTPAPKPSFTPDGYIPESEAAALQSISLAEDTVLSTRSDANKGLHRAALHRLETAKSELEAFRLRHQQ